MAKKVESKYKNWDEVNEAMKCLAELNVQKKQLENEQNARIDAVKKEINLIAADVLKKMDTVKKDITRFAEQHRDEFTQKRTKIMPFGKISFRYTKWVSCSDVQSAIKSLKKFALEKYLRVKEELDKDALLEADQQILTKCGIELKAADKISIEPDYVKLATLDTEVPF